MNGFGATDAGKGKGQWYGRQKTQKYKVELQARAEKGQRLNLNEA